MFWRALLLVCTVKCIEQTDVILSPEFNDVLENNTLEMNCYAPGNSRSTVWGTFNQPKIFSCLSFFKEGACTTDGFLNDTKYYETRCYSNATFKVKIKRVDISYHGQEWFCAHQFHKSNIAFISVHDTTEEQEEEQKEDSVESSSSRTLLFVAVGLLVLILLAAVLFFFVYRRRRQGASEREQIQEVNQITTCNYDDIAIYEEIDRAYDHLDARLKESTEYLKMETVETEKSHTDYLIPII